LNAVRFGWIESRVSLSSSPKVAASPYRAAALIALLAQALFSFRLTVPTKLMFDEVHYVPAARTLITLAGPRNIEHPLLGKEIIAGGILLLGDNSLGWRFFSTLAGTATVLGVFAIVWLMLGRVRPAVIGAHRP
jgi:dolichyl-phosphate-mannose-protein mannosyltransferase